MSVWNHVFWIFKEMWRCNAQVFRKKTLFRHKGSPAKPWLPSKFWFFVETLLTGFMWGVGWHFESNRTRSPLDLHKPVKLISNGIQSHRNTKNTECWQITLSLVRRSHSDLQKPANINSFFSGEEQQEQSQNKSSDPWLIKLLLSEQMADRFC